MKNSGRLPGILLIKRGTIGLLIKILLTDTKLKKEAFFICLITLFIPLYSSATAHPLTSKTTINGNCKRNQNSKLSIDCILQKNGNVINDNNFTVKIIDENNNETQFNANKGFNCELEYGHYYKLVIYSDNCTAKFITIDTGIENKKIYTYEFTINLKFNRKDDKVVNAGGIYYNKNINQFDYFLINDSKQHQFFKRAVF